jgi:hypothetical protein
MTPASNRTAHSEAVGKLCSSRRQQNALAFAIKEYGVLSRLGDEGLISAVRTEQEGAAARPLAHRTRRTARNAGGPPPAGV